MTSEGFRMQLGMESEGTGTLFNISVWMVGESDCNNKIIIIHEVKCNVLGQHWFIL